MTIIPGEKIQIARLFHFFLQAEQLAHDCARRQAELFPDAVSRKFFTAQARQEKFHYKVFQHGIGIMTPRGFGRSLINRPLQTYRRQVEASLARGDFVDSLLALQVILEGLGDVALERISDGVGKRGFGFNRIRKIILGQEDAHHAFGIKRLQQFNHDQPVRMTEHRQRFAELYQQIQRVTVSVEPLFEYFDENPRDYHTAFEAGLPDFLRSEQEVFCG